MNDSRTNELTAVLQRDGFDSIPGDLHYRPDGLAAINRWHEFRRKYHQVATELCETQFPLQVDFELNSHCNLRCSFCLHGHATVKKQELSISDFQRVIDEAEQYGLCSVKLNYINEPLLRQDLPEFIRYAKEQGNILNVYFATNGILLDESMSRRLILAGLNKLMISLDAVTPETFQMMRHSNKLEKIVANIETFLRVRTDLGVSYPLLRVNFLRTTRNQHEESLFVKRWQGIADMIGIQDQVGIPGIENAEHMPRSLDDFRCAFPFKMLVIDAHGEILPCCTFSGRSLSLGNIASMSLAEAWTSQKMQDLRAQHREYRWRSNSVCSHCLGA